MGYEFRSQGNVSVLLVPGRLDAVTYFAFEEVLLSFFQDPKKKLAVDFRKVDYISSTGLRALLRGAKQMKLTEGALALFGLSENILQVFAISGFQSLFAIFETEEEAIHHLKP